jgi:hypothetical protein
VEDILSAKRYNVVKRSIEGKIENSRGSLEYKVVRRIIIESEMFTINKTSSKRGDNGNIIKSIIPITTKAIKKSENFTSTPP